MTIFGWDASHYDGDLTVADLRRAKAEGIEFFSHKIGEGTSNTDTTAAAALTAARDAGIQAIGGYYFIHSGDMVAQATRCIALADRYVPWWRTFGGWFWQTDAETDTAGHLPSPSEVAEFSDTLEAQSGSRVIVYASHGMYADRLHGLGHPLWNANYPSIRRAPFRDLYPGDSYPGWTPYSGQTPAIAQYTSGATIAGHTTCDANAFRGTIDDLLTLITGGTAMSLIASDAHVVWAGSYEIPDMRDQSQPNVTAATALAQAWGTALAAKALAGANGVALASEQAAVNALTAAVHALATNGGTDVAPVLAAIADVKATESAALTAAQAEIADLHDQVASLRAALTAAAQAEHDALAATT